MTSTSFPDPRETRGSAEREADLMERLSRQVTHALQHSPAYQAAYAHLSIGPDGVASRAALAGLPVIRKHELLALQQQARQARPVSDDPRLRVFGGFATQGWGAAMPRAFASPGPIYEPDSLAADHWRMARAMHAAGFRQGELVHNSFSYHLVPAGAMMESGARALGCTVFPGGTGQTEQQLQAMLDLRPSAYVGTPSFLRILLEKAEDNATALPWLRTALVSGEACPPSLQAWFAERGIAAYQCYASADLGLIAYETSARQGLVVDEDVLVEIVRPGTGEPVPEGEVGEVVVTNFNADHPLLRFGTGDLSAVLPGPCPSGRSNTRLKGWMGRADQTTKVRGMFIHPGQVAEVARRLPGQPRVRLVVRGERADDQLVLQIAHPGPLNEELAAQCLQCVRDVTKLRADIEPVPPDQWANDGKVIVDERSYQ